MIFSIRKTAFAI